MRILAQHGKIAVYAEEQYRPVRVRHSFEASRYQVSVTLEGRMVFREFCKAHPVAVAAFENFDARIVCHEESFTPRRRYRSQ